MQQLRIFGFTDEEGTLALRREGCALAAQNVSVVVGGMLHALVGPEQPNWPWQDVGRMNLQKIMGYHRTLGLAAAELQKIVPASFESVFDGRNAVEQVLTQHQRDILDLMDKYGALRQFSLLVRWDDTVMQQLLRRAPAGRPLSLEQERRNLRDQLLLNLQGMLQDIIIIENSEGDVVLQALLLINKSDEPRLVTTLQRLDKECHGRLAMHLTGPLPACNFARVDVRLPDSTFVRQACRDLGLSEKARLVDIKNAYRQRAKHMHPDHTAEGGQHEVMVRLTQSYRYLTRLAAQQQDEAVGPANINPEKQWLHFDRKSLRRIPLMHVQRGITRWDDALLRRG